MFVKILDFLVHFDPFITTQKNGYIFFKIVFASGALELVHFEKYSISRSQRIFSKNIIS